MPRSHSTFAESLAASSTLETEETLLSQLEQLERRNNAIKKSAQAKDRVKAINECIQKCRQMMGVDDAGAALLYLKTLSVLEETERILNGGRTSALSNTNTQQQFQPATNIATSIAGSQSQKTTGFWTPAVAISPQKPEQLENEDDRYQYNYYGYHKSRWWRILCLNSAKEAKEKDSDVRDLWNTQIEFFLSCLGFIVGVGNTLRFPSMIYQYGGCTCICVSVSIQGLSASGAFWKMMPVASGIGWALVLLAVPVAIYYNIIVALVTLLPLGIFLTDGLPWSYCNKNWFVNTRFVCCELTPATLYSQNFTDCYNEQEQAMTATEAFFHYQVLNRSLLREFLIRCVLIALAIAWIFVFFGVFKGIGSIGWAVSITATIPYLMLIVLLLRALNLTGASDGIRYFFTIEFRDLWDLSLWRSAAVQVFYELGIDAGPLISMASFSRYRNNIYRDAVLLVLVDMFTSILCGLVIFSVLGFLANAQGNVVNETLKHDPLYLAFTAYPSVTTFMEWGFFWAALFFIMLTLSALDAEYAWLEMIASAIMNQLGSKNKSVETRLLVGLCLFCFICGIPLCARGGIFIFHSIENLNANWNSFSLSLMQVIVVCFIYGVDNFMEDIGEMLRERVNGMNFVVVSSTFLDPPAGYIKFSWCVFAPFILMTLLLASIFDYKRVKFNGSTLPFGYEAVAWVVMIGPLFVVPFTVGYTIYESWKRKRPLSSVVSGKNWRNKKIEQTQHHKIDTESEYMYIDPISRGASAKSRVAADVVNHDPTDEDCYAQATERVREWAARSSRTEPLRSFDVPSIVTTGDISYGPKSDDEELYGRRTGRLADIAKNPPPPSTPGSESDDEEFDEISEVDGERRLTVKKSPLMKSSALMSTDKPPFQLFGPPPMQQTPDPFEQSMSRINRKRAQVRRSDQHKNRVFNNNFNLIVMDPPSGSSSGGNNVDRTPSPCVPDRPDITDRRKRIGPRNSTESGTNISLSPFNIAPSTSTESAGDKEPFPMTLTIPKLKRPKPIGNIPSSSRKQDDNDKES
ncbi:Sodium-and chloride-dependent glycine transporter 2 [Aphelenchoides bicaudatus]|nr:Sodium-and chloride-dependent glycine transporter 2 [Aphelenchoides bicaudatus]